MREFGVTIGRQAGRQLSNDALAQTNPNYEAMAGIGLELAS